MKKTKLGGGRIRGIGKIRYETGVEEGGRKCFYVTKTVGERKGRTMYRLVTSSTPNALAPN